MTILETALKYQAKGFSVIPVDQNKIPIIKWEIYQKKIATEEEIKKWWTKSPHANIGIVTGELSNLFIVDCDTPEATQKIQEAIPDSLVVPCQKTPRGGMHFIFRHIQGYSNRARVAEGIDIRTSGGYFTVAPSVNGTGKSWEWVVSLFDADPPELVFAIKDIISNALSFSLRRVWSKNEKIDYAKRLGLFTVGSRNDDLFHVANALIKGKIETPYLQYVMEIIGRNCDPPFPEKELNETIKSAIQRAEKRERKLSEEVEEFVLTTTGNFLTTDVHKNLDLTTRDHKKNLTMILKRLSDKGIIERYGDKNGSWRRIDRSMVEQCWWEAKGNPLDIKFPLDVEQFAKIFPGNIMLLEGQKSQGKSAFAIEFCRLNKRLYKHKILYQNVEMSDDELLDRFRSYEDVMTPEEWRESVTFVRQTSEWWDKVDEDGLNVIDYLIEYKESYLIADFVWKIHQKLKSGIALVIVQRDPFKPYPTGGRGVRDIPRLIMSLMHHKIKLEDVKSFHMSPQGNPSGMVRKYKQKSWWKFIPTSDWERQEDEKYDKFLKGGQD